MRYHAPGVRAFQGSSNRGTATVHARVGQGRGCRAAGGGQSGAAAAHSNAPACKATPRRPSKPVLLLTRLNEREKRRLHTDTDMKRLFYTTDCTHKTRKAERKKGRGGMEAERLQGQATKGAKWLSQVMPPPAAGGSTKQAPTRQPAASQYPPILAAADDGPVHLRSSTRRAQTRRPSRSTRRAPASSPRARPSRTPSSSRPGGSSRRPRSRA